MSVMARRVRAAPHRSATETWIAIVDCIAPLPETAARRELLGVAGIASSLIADEALKDSACVISGSGPRVRIYCLYGEDAITGENAAEDALSFSATADGWQMSLPCPPEDLEWVQATLKLRAAHVTARDMTTAVDEKAVDGKNLADVTINLEAFLRP